MAGLTFATSSLYLLACLNAVSVYTLDDSRPVCVVQYVCVETARSLRSFHTASAVSNSYFIIDVC